VPDLTPPAPPVLLAGRVAPPEPPSDAVATVPVEQRPRSQPTQLTATGVAGLPEVRAGDDLAALVLAALAAAGQHLADGDVLVVSSKVLSKAAGLTLVTDDRDDVVATESVRLVAERRTPRGLSQVVQSAAGPVMAAAGVDASNTAPGTVLTLPPDPDAAARHLRARLRAQGAPRVAVVVSDTAGRAWRRGQVDFALGCAGLVVVDDLRGTQDASGQPLEVTERVLADEVAALADLVKGKTSGVPVALVRGLSGLVTDDDGPGAASLLRDPASDWFRLGHVEAVRAALGCVPGAVEPPSVLPEPVAHRTARAASVALTAAPDLAGEPPHEVVAVDGGARVRVRVPDPFAAGVCASRLRTALWAEDLTADVRFDPSRRTLEVNVRPA
jgi:coenzyme F420-0:L-glutamate ligase/coenzyme F420-1:gamma-L-glutamate ligase